ncbi:hypothetical protein AVEN_239922-1 [Araneus ventricosus]|uniref:Uncharacterized protein n=1 Tax=Araneus ventricosus TaxID=182803 RepID=A0A4Y2S6G8_ARAVE|nr:hypothetical protein AVEN_239922-1 [Araneus ventricosus]
MKPILSYLKQHNKLAAPESNDANPVHNREVHDGLFPTFPPQKTDLPNFRRSISPEAQSTYHTEITEPPKLPVVVVWPSDGVAE